jgi:hypothetical protein
MRYVDRQRASDAFFPPGRRHCWKAGWQRRLAPDLSHPRSLRRDYERLAAIKEIYDPTNFFRSNQNVATTPRLN